MNETEKIENKESETDIIKTIKAEFDKQLKEQAESHAKELKELEDKLKREHNEQIKCLLSGAKTLSTLEQEEVEEEDEVQQAVKRLTEKFKRKR